jgi:hypothetical protein
MVTITPSVTTGTHQKGVPYTVMLNQGQTYQYFDTTVGNDLTGTSITSTQPIALFGGNQCADVPPGASFCNLLVEELPPTSAWGMNFFTVPLATRSGGDTFRFLASKNMTHVSVNGTVVATLNRGQFFEQLIATASQITSDQPILVAQYSNSGSFDGASADPFMMLVPPAAQYLASYTVTTPAVNFPTNFVNIVALTSGTGTIKLDGTAIAATMFSPIGTSGFSAAQVPLTVGSHNLTGGVPFMVIVYGFFTADGYCYVGGLSFSPIALVTTVTLAPATSTASTGTQACLTATVKDQNSMPVGAVRVDFTVTGANPTSGFVNAAANGQAQFCYTGTVVGADTITAAVGSILGTATVNWSPAVTSPGTFAPAPGTSTTATIVPGDTAQFTIVFQPNPGFTGVVTLTCTNSIPNTRCTISPATANITSSAPITLTVMLQTNCTAILPPYLASRRLPPGWEVPYVLALAIALILSIWYRRRSTARSFLSSGRHSGVVPRLGWLVPSLALVLLTLSWVGCSSTSDPPLIPGAPSTPPGKYSIVITGTSAWEARPSVSISRSCDVFEVGALLAASLRKLTHCGAGCDRPTEGAPQAAPLRGLAEDARRLR